MRIGMIIRYLTAKESQMFRQIRLEALRTDPDAFGELYDEAVQRTDREWLDWLSNVIVPERKNVACAERDGEVIGMYGFGLSDADLKTGFLWGMFVSLESRGFGIGKMMLEEAERWISARGGRRIKSCVAAPNDGAIRFYRNCGYEIGPASNTLRPGSLIPVHSIEKRLNE